MMSSQRHKTKEGRHAQLKRNRRRRKISEEEENSGENSMWWLKEARKKDLQGMKTFSNEEKRGEGKGRKLSE